MNSSTTHYNFELSKSQKFRASKLRSTQVPTNQVVKTWKFGKFIKRKVTHENKIRNFDTLAFQVSRFEIIGFAQNTFPKNGLGMLFSFEELLQ